MGEKRQVYCQQWTESEAGWGQRPDGYSLHLTLEGHALFCKKYWKGMPAATPEVYAREEGEPYLCEVSEEVFRQVKQAWRNGGLRVYENHYPSPVAGQSGGPWRVLKGGGRGLA